MLIYNCLSFYLQLIINITLFIGLTLFLKNGIKVKMLIVIFPLGELALELFDLICRFFKLNSFNTYNYPISQFFGLIIITEVYAKYFLKLPGLIKSGIYIFAIIFLIINIAYTNNIKFTTFYSNIITNIIICSFAAVYFFNIIKIARVERAFFILNVFVFLFFSVESLISIMFNFLINNHLKWVAPIWLFREVLLLSFYVAFINFGYRTWKIRA